MERSQVHNAYCECRKAHRTEIDTAKASCATDYTPARVEQFVQRVKNVIKCNNMDE